MYLRDLFTGLDKIRSLDNVTVIGYGAEDVTIKGNDIRIGALALSQGSWNNYGPEYFQRHEDENRYFILMSHYPWSIPDNYPGTSVDVVLCGHAHGGQIHLWNDIGMFAPDKGFFAPYTSGIHNIQGTTEIISRGLGDHTVIPRINNQPELVVIHFRKES